MSKPRSLLGRGCHTTPGRHVGQDADWSALARFIPDGLSGLLRRSAVSATFVAALELARQGRIVLRQHEVFSPIYVKPA